MATLQTDIAAGQQSPLVENRVDGQRVTGQRRYVTAILTLTGSEAAGDLIEIADIPVGAILVPGACRVTNEASGGTGTAISKIGDSADDDRYSATAIALTTAATALVTPVVATGIIAQYAVTAATRRIIGTLALSSGSTTAGRKVVFELAYRMP